MKFKQSLLGILAAVVVTVPVSAMAENHWRGGGDIRHFHEVDIHHWATGHWYHGPHDGRLGWWWVVGATVDTALWYSYAAPVYPYPDPYAPPAVMVEQAPPVAAAPVMQPPATPSNWYYCKGSNQYYPYVATCSGGWMQVPVTPSAQ